jgi:glutamate racemase
LAVLGLARILQGVCGHYRYDEEQMKSILDPSFKYIPSTSTDVSRTFAKALREERLKAKKMEEQRRIVTDIFKLKSK